MEEVKGVIEEVSAFDSSQDASADFSAASGLPKVRESYLSTVSQCKALWQLALPQFGMYSYEYEWANLISAYHCNADPIPRSLLQRSRDDFDFEQGKRAQLFENMVQQLPRQFLKMREDEHLAERNRSLFEMLDSELVRHLQEPGN